MKFRIKSVLTASLLFALSAAMVYAGGGQQSGGAASSGDRRTPIVIKVSTVQLPTQQMGIGLKQLEDNIKKELGDWVDFRGYDSAQLYSGAEELEAVGRGEVQMVFAIGGAMETISNRIQIVKLPWLFPSLATAYKVLDDGETGRQIFAPVDQAGMAVLGLFSSGSATVANNKRPLRVPADFRGLKMRAPGKMDTLNINSLGANAVVTPSEETYSAVQQGVIDGMSTPSTVFVPRRFYEVQKYVTNSDNMSMQIGYLVGNKSWYNGLPAEFRAGLDRAIDATITQMRRDVEEQDAELYARMAQEGCEVHNLTDNEKAQWKAASEAVYVEMERELGADLIALARRESSTL
ncbi:MAG: TRAP transporter substrate-binding protein [Treponema sp.]|jgi:C4-dicarboxylate-binding protein DctP|nr:TRAP transporter substrate-binding protein [Treponema sp.]